ncbi:hypothetical protein [Tsukamurella sp. 1534]|uniref:hypothetical protein n=1 Tax=Tsukamurella sp. 1534 TaxID=1151061 RepID=UPI0003193152|nr:hypothetical protein [Tsukamurella sp. 1534]
MLGTETVTFTRTGGVDDDGYPLPATTWEVDDCDIQSGSGTETLGTDRSAAAQQVSVFVPAPAPAIEHGDTLAFRGLSGWRIVGDPVEWIDEDPELSGWSLIVTRGEG